jgi:hypothetical protein
MIAAVLTHESRRRNLIVLYTTPRLPNSFLTSSSKNTLGMLGLEKDCGALMNGCSALEKPLRHNVVHTNTRSVVTQKR